MSGEEALDDDYVIALLKRDAEANKDRYISSGFGSQLSSQPRSKNAPRPNTRFLKHIVRDVDSHNAALKAKEEEEARARLKELRRKSGVGKRKRDEDDSATSRSKHRIIAERQDRWAAAFGGLGRANKDKSLVDKKKEDGRQLTKGKHDRIRERDMDDCINGERSRDEDRQSPMLHSAKGLSAKHHSERRSKAASPLVDRRHHRHRDRQSTDSSGRRTQNQERLSDSDPLDTTLGPQPASTARGRGATNAEGQSGMDARFDPSYNPKADIGTEDVDESDDWDMALEALRDRAKWRAQGAERLKAAGFNDEEINRWENGGEKDIEDVRWKKKGEGREWDRGKIVDADGAVSVRAAWTTS